MVDNGRRAVEALHRKDYEAVFMDIEMPELDGPSATRQLRVELAPVRHPSSPR